jgi:hypothetical protein
MELPQRHRGHGVQIRIFGVPNSPSVRVFALIVQARCSSIRNENGRRAAAKFMNAVGYPVFFNFLSLNSVFSVSVW